jgi:hypothetical protein
MRDHEYVRLFSLDEARAMLAPIRAAVRALQEDKRVLEQLGAELGAIAPAQRANGWAARAEELNREIQQRMASVQGGIAGLADQGVLVQDIDEGILDFPSERDGEIVYLCWQVNEPTISYWHRVEDGFAGRRPV